MTVEKLPLPSRLYRRSVAQIREEVVSTLRHELRNKLAAVRNSSFYIRKRVDTKTTLAQEDPRIPQFFKVIDDELNAATSVLEPGQPAQSSGPTNVALGPFLQQLVAELSVDKRVDLELLAPAAVVRCDPEALAVALHALLENAFEASADDGHVLLRVKPADDGTLRVDIVDRGGGLPSGGPSAALKPFFSTKPGRLGVGLNVARRIAQGSGGNLELAAEEGGTRATLVLLAPKEAA